MHRVVLALLLWFVAGVSSAATLPIRVDCVRLGGQDVRLCWDALSMCYFQDDDADEEKDPGEVCFNESGLGGDSIQVNAVAAVDANFVNTGTILWTIDTVSTPDEISAALAEDPLWESELDSWAEFLGQVPITGTPDGTKFLRDDGSWQPVTAGSGTFTGLTDTPGSITPLNYMRGNGGGTALEFRTAAQVIGDLGAESETHASEHNENAADELLVENLGTACTDGFGFTSLSGGVGCEDLLTEAELDTLAELNTQLTDATLADGPHTIDLTTTAGDLATGVTKDGASICLENGTDCPSGGGGEANVLEDVGSCVGGSNPGDACTLAGGECSGGTCTFGTIGLSAGKDGTSLLIKGLSAGANCTWTGNAGTATIDCDNTQLSQEQVEDFVGALVTAGSQTGIAVTYNDNGGAAGNIAFSVQFSLQDLTDVGAISGAQGQILIRNATEWVALAPGAADRYLATKGAGQNPVWQQIDHGAHLAGTGDDDHGQYMLDAGTGVENRFPKFVNTDGRTMQPGQTSEDVSGNLQSVAEIRAAGDIGTDLCVRIGDADSDANSDCICRDATGLFSDLNCNGGKELGEPRLNQGDFGGTLPTSPFLNQYFLLTNDTTAGACTPGGTAKTWCVWNGSAWVAAGGSGDMTKAVYDTPSVGSVDGIVDRAEAVQGITTYLVDPTVADDTAGLQTAVDTCISDQGSDPDQNGCLIVLDDVDYTWDVDWGINSDCTGPGAPNACCSGAGMGTCVQIPIDIRDQAGDDSDNITIRCGPGTRIIDHENMGWIDSPIPIRIEHSKNVTIEGCTFDFLDTCTTNCGPDSGSPISGGGGGHVIGIGDGAENVLIDNVTVYARDAENTDSRNDWRGIWVTTNAPGHTRNVTIQNSRVYSDTRCFESKVDRGGLGTFGVSGPHEGIKWLYNYCEWDGYRPSVQAGGGADLVAPGMGYAIRGGASVVIGNICNRIGEWSSDTEGISCGQITNVGTTGPENAGTVVDSTLVMGNKAYGGGRNGGGFQINAQNSVQMIGNQVEVGWCDVEQQITVFDDTNCTGAGAPYGCCTGAGMGTCDADAIPLQFCRVNEDCFGGDTGTHNDESDDPVDGGADPCAYGDTWINRTDGETFYCVATNDWEPNLCESTTGGCYRIDSGPHTDSGGRGNIVTGNICGNDKRGIADNDIGGCFVIEPCRDEDDDGDCQNDPGENSGNIVKDNVCYLRPGDNEDGWGTGDHGDFGTHDAAMTWVAQNNVIGPNTIIGGTFERRGHLNLYNPVRFIFQSDENGTQRCWGFDGTNVGFDADCGTPFAVDVISDPGTVEAATIRALPSTSPGAISLPEDNQKNGDVVIIQAPPGGFDFTDPCESAGVLAQDGGFVESPSGTKTCTLNTCGSIPKECVEEGVLGGSGVAGAFDLDADGVYELASGVAPDGTIGSYSQQSDGYDLCPTGRICLCGDASDGFEGNWLWCQDDLGIVRTAPQATPAMTLFDADITGNADQSAARFIVDDCSDPTTTTNCIAKLETLFSDTMTTFIELDPVTAAVEMKLALQLFSSATPAVDAVGEVAVDTTDQGVANYQLAIADDTGTKRSISDVFQHCQPIEALAMADDDKPFYMNTAYTDLTLISASCVCIGTCTDPADLTLEIDNVNSDTIDAVTGTLVCGNSAAADPDQTNQALTVNTNLDQFDVLRFDNVEIDQTPETDDYVVCVNMRPVAQ